MAPLPPFPTTALRLRVPKEMFPLGAHCVPHLLEQHQGTTSRLPLVHLVCRYLGTEIQIENEVQHCGDLPYSHLFILSQWLAEKTALLHPEMESCAPFIES